MKILWNLSLIGILGLVLAGVALWYVNSYVYAWSYFFTINCEHKQIRTIPDSERLNQFFNLSEIYDKLKAGTNSSGFEVYLKDGQLGISKTVDNLQYIIRIGDFQGSNRVYQKVLFANKAITPEKSGESATFPDYKIYERVFQIIDEIPLNAEQRSELKAKVGISCGGGRMPS